MKYSIILPVRNGGGFIKDCVGSILHQTNPDFELLILENKSTDNTPQYLESLTDPRVKIFSSEYSLTIEQNWQRIRGLSKSPYMTMIGHDDVLHPQYLATIDLLTTSHPSASLYQTHFNYIDSEGNEIRNCQCMPGIMDASTVTSRLLAGSMDIMGTGFMMRSADFDKVGGMPDYPSLLFADMELWIRMTKLGYLAVSDKTLFSYRLHPSAMTRTSSSGNVYRAFSRFVEFLMTVNNEAELRNAVRQGAPNLLRQYVKGISHKILRTPVESRDTPPVADVVNEFRKFGQKLGIPFEPTDQRSVELAVMIDQSYLLRKGFLLLRKLFPKPIL